MAREPHTASLGQSLRPFRKHPGLTVVLVRPASTHYSTVTIGIVLPPKSTLIAIQTHKHPRVCNYQAMKQQTVSGSRLDPPMLRLSKHIQICKAARPRQPFATNCPTLNQKPHLMAHRVPMNLPQVFMLPTSLLEVLCCIFVAQLCSRDHPHA